MHDPIQPARQPIALRATAVILALCLLLLIVIVGARMISQQSDLAAAHRDTTQRTHQIDALISQIRRDSADAAQDRATAARNQRALLAYTKALAIRQDALLGYLRAHGIHLPTRLVTEITPPRIITHRHHSGSRLTRHHRRSSSTSSTTPAGPGKSGSAPGHHKHPRRGHHR